MSEKSPVFAGPSSAVRSRCAQVTIGARSTTAGARHGDHGRMGARIPRGAPRDRAFERARLSRARGCAGRCDGRGSALVLARDVRRRCPLPTRFRRDRPRRRRRPRLGREQRPQLRHHRARRPRQDHAAGHPDAAGEPGRLHRAARRTTGIWSASAASAPSPSTPLSTTRAPRSTRWTRRDTPTLAAKWSACWTWSTGACCSWTASRGRWRKPSSAAGQSP